MTSDDPIEESRAATGMVAVCGGVCALLDILPVVGKIALGLAAVALLIAAPLIGGDRGAVLFVIGILALLVEGWLVAGTSFWTNLWAPPREMTLCGCDHRQRPEEGHDET